MRGRTWTPHGAGQSQTSSRTTRRQGTERQPASARCCLRTYARSSSPKTSISAHTGNMLVQNTLTRRRTASGNGVRGAGQLTSQHGAPPHSCLQTELLPQKRDEKGGTQMARSSRRRSLVQTRRGTRAETKAAPGNYKTCQWESGVGFPAAPGQDAIVTEAHEGRLSKVPCKQGFCWCQVKRARQESHRGTWPPGGVGTLRQDRSLLQVPPRAHLDSASPSIWGCHPAELAQPLVTLRWPKASDTRGEEGEALPLWPRQGDGHFQNGPGVQVFQLLLLFKETGQVQLAGPWRLWLVTNETHLRRSPTQSEHSPRQWSP